MDGIKLFGWSKINQFCFLIFNIEMNTNEDFSSDCAEYNREKKETLYQFKEVFPDLDKPIVAG